MTEENHCYENAIAERVNGILKDEFYLDQCFSSTEHARIAAKNAISIYNSKRLHLSLGYKTPNMVFTKCSLIYCLACRLILGQDTL
jgi:transposase InsO family protein